MGGAIEGKSFAFKKAFYRPRNKAISCFSGRSDSIFCTRFRFLSSRSIKNVSTSNDTPTDVFHTRDKYRQSRFALGAHPWRTWPEDAGVTGYRIKVTGSEQNRIPLQSASDFTSHANSERSGFRDERHLQFTFWDTTYFLRFLREKRILIFARIKILTEMSLRDLCVMYHYYLYIYPYYIIIFYPNFS